MRASVKGQHLKQLNLLRFHPVDPVVYFRKFGLEARHKKFVQAELEMRDI